jgi:hypothetical protein
MGAIAPTPGRSTVVIAGAGFALMLFALGGCGDSEPPADAEVTVYVSAPDTAAGERLVSQSKAAIAGADSDAGGVAVRAVYLEAAPDPAAIAANARQAVEDSTSIAYIGEVDPKAELSSAPIINEAGLLQVQPAPDAMAQVLEAIDEADDPLDRESVADALR